MKKPTFLLLLTVLVVLLLSACSKNGESSEAADPKLSPQEMVEQLTKQFEQPPQTDLEENGVEELYHLDPSLLEAYSIKIPLMNVKTNEVAVLKMKNAKDADVVKKGIEQRAADVQKQFETYLPDQYENAKNYQTSVKGNYVFFAIGEQADEMVNAFNGLFEAK
ncbi:DUF4358 domain-containing protein [Paenibacillus glycanilyticus]|uniref:DUF4358 domain-containing protein n=1 Tax=Paenibacillus glycanilyticus TaxID=126569 RepID=A0ABQ6GJT3_9BACL|nr:DUF4358 domain-containing protein [Paenibacillus glycanilyticus]GLX69891.1 hypothetical protein MU1_42370 [Paenibacillus glycanilyticus]